MSVTEKLQDYELRLNRLTERAVERGKIEERLRINTIIAEKYEVAFRSSPIVAKALQDLLKAIGS